MVFQIFAANFTTATGAARTGSATAMLIRAGVGCKVPPGDGLANFALVLDAAASLVAGDLIL